MDSVLIANRGEIACRIARTARRMGLRVIAVHSPHDAGALHVASADEAVLLEHGYLDIEGLLQAARARNATAVHPGYGFLAENADFARACAGAGLTFVGPSPEAIAAMGHKRQARELMQRAGVPVLPETRDFPLMVKPSAGGGGKGMRLVQKAQDLEEALQAARREAQAAFGDDDLILERALPVARHVEVQVLGDRHGTLLALGERDCSIQRRHQKILEETPAPGLDPDLRSRMQEAALQAARAVQYVGAGTVEFLLEPDGRFWFLEMNTRLQVEHPVTEAVTGLDLVEWQFRVAAGERLPEAPAPRGHAIEARIYAEDPDRGFLPATGRLLRWRMPTQARVDSGVREGDVVTPHYDPLLAKVIVHDQDRAEALRRLRRALDEARIAGVVTNLPFLRRVARHPAYQDARLHIGFLQEHALPPEPTPESAWLAAAVHRGVPGWRNGVATPRPSRWTDGSRVVELSVTSSDSPPAAEVVPDGETLWVLAEGHVARLRELPLQGHEHDHDADREIRSPMPGAVRLVLVQAGDPVQKGQPLLKLEAMKMEHTLTAGFDGRVEALHCAVGDQVAADQVLARLTS